MTTAISVTAPERLKAQLAGLVVACPFTQGNPTDCPLCAIRDDSLGKRIDWLHKLTPEEIEELTSHHRECLASKEQSTDAIL